MNSEIEAAPRTPAAQKRTFHKIEYPKKVGLPQFLFEAALFYWMLIDFHLFAL
jgi:hypothetical protein